MVLDKKQCEYCQFKWQPRKEVVVACPRCKRRFDYPIKKEV